MIQPKSPTPEAPLTEDIMDDDFFALDSVTPGDEKDMSEAEEDDSGVTDNSILAETIDTTGSSSSITRTSLFLVLLAIVYLW